jgi:hypothetical protein
MAMGGGCGVEVGYWRDGVSAYRRVDMRAATSALPFRCDYPSVSLVNHFNDLGYNLIAIFIKFIKDLLAQVAMPNSNLDMNWVSAGSVSASLSFATKAARYRLFLHASAKFAQTERERVVLHFFYRRYAVTPTRRYAKYPSHCSCATNNSSTI